MTRISQYIAAGLVGIVIALGAAILFAEGVFPGMLVGWLR